MIKLKKTSKIYILCPANIATGGPESIHLLCEALLKKGHDANIVYLNNAYPGGGGHPGHGYVDRSDNWMSYVSTTGKHAEYNQYNTIAVDTIIDNSNNLLIAPEIYLNALEKFENIQTAVWWLASRIQEDGTYDPLQWFSGEDRSVHHLHNSNFAEHMLRSCGQFDDSRIYPLETYVNTKFNLLPSLWQECKDDIVCYNPKKGQQYTEQVIQAMTDQMRPQTQFIPIVNMNRSEVLDTLRRAKVYIDFGHHPGRERMPREAVQCGCCVLTGFRGSAQFFKDVPVLDKYKFEVGEQFNPKDVCKTIHHCIDNYSEVTADFDYYRRVMKNNKSQFSINVDNIFGNV